MPITAVAAVVAGGIIAIAPGASAALSFPIEALDGNGNNVANPNQGKANTPYLRVGPARYADGISAPLTGPNARNTSNRIFNDQNQDVFSERRVTQWVWTWGQFLDHTFGLRDGGGPTATAFNIPFSATDPLEQFSNSLGQIPLNRSAAVAGTGTSTANPRQQLNTLASYLNGNPVYGPSNSRLDWLRVGSQDGNPANNDANLLMSATNYLPAATARGNAATAPVMDTDGRLAAHPQDRKIAGDVRANENIALTATHTLFAREHNRIVSLLPASLSQEDKFQIARRVVIAEQQYITYQEWLPSLGVALPQYTGYKTNVNSSISNEFATIGYRAHSQIHGEFEIETDLDRYTQAELDALAAKGVVVEIDGEEVALVVALNLAFFNPDLLENLKLGPMLASLNGESQYNNDENIDNQLRSVLFQIPVSGNPDCTDSEEINGVHTPACFNSVNDLAAVDIVRARDHGLGTYNQLRQAYGLPAVTSFTQITGESTDAFPSGVNINSPNQLDVTQLFNVDGVSLTLGSDEAAATATRDVRRTTVAARLKAIYGNVNNIDAFTGVYAEKHVVGTEMGETNLAIWTKQFQALRDGDRFYFGNDQGLSTIKTTYGIDFRHTLADVVKANNPDIADDIASNVFLVNDANFNATTCTIQYTISPDGAANRFNATVRVTNNTNQTIVGWTARFQLAQGQDIQFSSGAQMTQSAVNGPTFGRDVTASSVFGTNFIEPGTSETFTFNSTFDRQVNAIPPTFTLNNSRCKQNNRA